MRVPVWVTLGVAILVIAFGLYRVRMALRKPATEDNKPSVMGGGFYKMSPRAHLVIGLLYLSLGGALIATTFGWNPLGGAFGGSSDAAAKDSAPAKTGSAAHGSGVEIELSR